MHGQMKKAKQKNCLSLQKEKVTVNPFSAGPAETKPFFRIQISPAEAEDTAEISAQAYHQTSKSSQGFVKHPGGEIGIRDA